MPVQDLSMDGISVFMDPANKRAGAPAMAVGCGEMCRAGFIVENAANVRLNDVDLYNQIGPALTVKNSQDVFVGDIHASADRMENLVMIDGAEHEVMVERDLFRDRFWAAFDAFIPGVEVEMARAAP